MNPRNMPMFGNWKPHWTPEVVSKNRRQCKLKDSKRAQARRAKRKRKKMRRK